MGRKKLNLVALLKQTKIPENDNLLEMVPYTDEEVYEVLDELSKDELKILQIKYGANLDETNDITNPYHVKMIANVIKAVRKRLEQKRREIVNLDYSKLKVAPQIPPALADKMLELGYKMPKKDELPDTLKTVNVTLDKEKEYTNPNENLATSQTRLDPLQVIENIIKTETLSEVETILTVEEAIVLILRLGSSELGCFDEKSIAQMFNISIYEVVEILKSATEKYNQAINKAIESEKIAKQKSL